MEYKIYKDSDYYEIFTFDDSGNKHIAATTSLIKWATNYPNTNLHELFIAITVTSMKPIKNNMTLIDNFVRGKSYRDTFYGD